MLGVGRFDAQELARAALAAASSQDAPAIEELVDAARRTNHVYNEDGSDSPACRICAAITAYLAAAPSSQDAAAAPADPLEGHVEVDWDRPLDEWETAFKDELFLWAPFFRGLGHAHMRLDANAKYALARIAGILHRSAPPADAAPGLREALVECREVLAWLKGLGVLGASRLATNEVVDAIAKADAALGAAPPRSGEAT